MAGGWEVYLSRTRGDRTRLVSAWYVAFWVAFIVGPAILAITHSSTFGLHGSSLIGFACVAALFVGVLVCVELLRSTDCTDRTAEACKLPATRGAGQQTGSFQNARSPGRESAMH